MAGEQEIASMYVGIRGDASSALNALKQTQQGMQQASNQAKAAGGSFNNVSTTIGKIHNPLNQLVGAIGGVAVAFGLVKAASAAWDLGMTAARVHEMDAVLRSLAQNSGASVDAVMAGVAAIKKMGIETQVAQNAMAQFTRYQMDMTKAADLARVAQDAAVLSGQNSSEALDGLIYGITTYNQRVIRTYGMNVDMSTAFDTMAASLGKNADALSEAEKVQAALNAVIAEGTRITGTYAAAMEEPGKRWRSLPRYVNEIKVALGEAFLPIVGAAADGLTNMAKAVLNNADTFAALFKAIGEGIGYVITLVTNVATLGLNFIAADESMRKANASIADLGGVAASQTPIIDDLARRWDALNDAMEIKAAIAFKMQRTADVAAYMASHMAHTKTRVEELSAAYAKGEIGMVEYNNAIWALAAQNGIAAESFYELREAEQAAMEAQNDVEAGYRQSVNSSRQALADRRAAAEAARTAVRHYKAEAAAIAEVAYASERVARGGSGAWRKNAMSEFAGARDSAAGGGGGVDTGKQIAERQAQWERDRVTNARRAGLEISYWEQDQQEWIADNAATLSAELQAEFAARTTAAKAEAERVKETDAGLAQELLDAESEYQQEKASIASDEGLSEEERAKKMEILERENTERVARAKETAALEAQIQEEERQREIQQMREAGAAGGQAFAEEVQKAFDKMQDAEGRRQERMRKAKDEAKEGWGTIFDDAILDAQTLLGLAGQVVPAADGLGGSGAPMAGSAGSSPQHPGGPIEGAYASGGVVPGPVGAPQVAVVHGGEKITPPDRVENQGGGVSVYVTGPVYASTPEQATRAGEDMGRGIRMAAKGGGVSV